ncbi:tRNA wybutosine-synthesizing protein 4, partial [Frankliniella fusca]
LVWEVPLPPDTKSAFEFDSLFLSSPTRTTITLDQHPESFGDRAPLAESFCKFNYVPTTSDLSFQESKLDSPPLLPLLSTSLSPPPQEQTPIPPVQPMATKIQPVFQPFHEVIESCGDSLVLDGTLSFRDLDAPGNDGILKPDTISSTIPWNEHPDIIEIFHSLDLTPEIFCDRNELDSPSAAPAAECERFVDPREYFTLDDDPLEHSDSTFGFEDQSCGTQQSIPGDQLSADPPIYKGAKVTLSELAVAFLSLMLGNDISGELLGRFLLFIQLILPDHSNFFTSLYSVFQHFKHLKAPVNFIYYCSLCFRALETKDSVCQRCGGKSKVNYYLHLPIIPQIKSLYSNSNFVESLSYRFNSKNMQKIILKISMMESYTNQPMTFYLIRIIHPCPGIQMVFLFSTLVIFKYDLSTLLLMNCHHTLGGLAFGSEKPACNVFLKPICQETETLANGINVNLPKSESTVNVKSIVLCGTCDALAKSAFMRMTNFNGFYGCPRCLSKGVYNKEGKVFTYPFEENVAERTLEGYTDNLNTLRASETKDAVCGVKGPTYLFKMWMSCIMCILVFAVRYSFNDFIKQVFGENAEKKVLFETFSEILCKMQAPHYMSRPTRSLSHVNYFKAAEFRTWLFSTSLPLIRNRMTEVYFEHFKKLVCLISLLNQASVSLQDVELARSLLRSFVHDFQELFGVRNMSFNIHCLRHLPDVTLAFGPLWVSSCFGYESLNGRLARLVHGTRHAGLQIYSHLGLLKNLSTLEASLKNADVKSFCKQMRLKSHQFKIAAKIQNGILVLGNVVKEHKILPPIFNDALSLACNVDAKYFFYFRLKKDGFLYVAEYYGKGTRNSSCVKYKSSGREFSYGCIKTFVKVAECMCDTFCNHPGTNVALINRFNCSIPFQTSSPMVEINSILSCVLTNDKELVLIEDLECVCFKISVDEYEYLSVPLNLYELE